MNLNTGQKPCDVTDDTRQRRPPALPQPVRQPMADHGMKPRIGEDDFPRGARGWVTLKHGADVFSKFLQKHKCFQNGSLSFRSSRGRGNSLNGIGFPLAFLSLYNLYSIL